MLNQFWNVARVILQVTVHGHNHITSSGINACLHCGCLLKITEQTNQANMRPKLFGCQIQLIPRSITATVIYHDQFPWKWVVQ